MASSADNNGDKVIVHNLLPHIVVYSDGTIDRPRNFPIVPPQEEDPETGVSSKDIVFSNDPYLTARLFLPKLTQTNDQNQKLTILVYFHGGGFTFESAYSNIHHAYCNLIASQANAVIATIEHRKAPEYYLPTAYNDCWAGLCWVASHATKNPINSDPWIANHGDFNRIFIGGDSSGGNLAHNVAMRAGVEALPGG
ncbi:putative carboxylesterase 12-like, partial [Trifolium medium]|nr:putative carboxylesterase 12-like [Trifolium medium]